MANRVCWACGITSHMTRQQSNATRQLDGLHFRHEAAYLCDECGRMSIGVFMVSRDQTSDFDRYTQLRDPDQWLPEVGTGKDFPDVPPHIADAADEAHRCYSIQAYRGAASLARAVVEATAKEKGITQGQIYQKIEALHADGHIREHIREGAHEVRHLGNEVAHGDFVDPVEAEEAWESLELMGEVLQEVFQSPARVAKAKAARQARKGQTPQTP